MLPRDFCVWVGADTEFLDAPHGHGTASPRRIEHDGGVLELAVKQSVWVS